MSRTRVWVGEPGTGTGRDEIQTKLKLDLGPRSYITLPVSGGPLSPALPSCLVYLRTGIMPSRILCPPCT